jgi:PAS domain S-box-containing protein
LTDSRRDQPPSSDEPSAALDSVLAAALDAVITMDERGRVTRFNPAAERMFGYSREQALGRTVAELVVPPKRRRAHRSSLKRVVAGRPPRILGRRVVVNAMRADRSELPVELTVTRTQESPPRFTAWIRDLSERRASEAQARRQEERLEHAERAALRLESAVIEQGSAAEASEELLRSAFDRAPIGMSVVAADGRWLRVNDAYCRMLGYTREALVGTTFRELTHPDDVAEDDEFVSAVAAGETSSLERERRYLHRDGSIVWVHVRAEVIRNEAGEPLYAVSHLQDITDRKRSAERLRDSERWLRSVIDNTPALIYVKGRDYRYQLVNAEFETVFGVRGDWIVGRSDEDILPASAVAEVRAKDRLVLDGGEAVQEEEATWRDGQERVFLTVRFPLLDEQGAVQAMCGMSTDITDRRLEERSRRERLECSERIHSALTEGRFVLHGQAIVNLASMQVEQAELLIRMLKVRGGEGLEEPREFLPAAERFDLIQVIDEWVIARACELAAAGHRVEVNLSAKTIADPTQVDRIEREVIDSGASPQNLIFEITETAVAENLDAARTFAQRLRKLGCSFALDDFGIGHGTFTYLRHLPVDYLKIDIQFVRHLLSEEEDRQVVRAIVGVAKQFEIKTIAEGVEDEATLKALHRMGVDYAQGYWLGRPMPLRQLWQVRVNRGGDTGATRP